MPTGVYKRTKEMKIGKFKRTKKIKEKISNSVKQKMTKEMRKKISNSMKGKKRPKKVKLKISKTMKRLYKEGKRINDGSKNSKTMKRLYKEGKLKPNSGCFKKRHKQLRKSHKGKILRDKVIIKCKICNNKISVNYGKRKKIKYCSRKCYGDDLRKRYNLNGNPSWRGGLSFEPYSPEFNKKLKEQIKIRDNFTCQLCGDKILNKRIIKGNNLSKNWLVIHHIDYNKKNSNPNNLITLCNFCNLSVNTSREEWTKQFKNKIGEII